MIVKSVVCPCALVVMLLGANAIRGEEPLMPVGDLGMPRLTQPAQTSTSADEETDKATSPGTPTDSDAPEQPAGPDGALGPIGASEHHPTLPASAGLSHWLTYTQPDCCGPLGGAPILSEVYLRNGVSVPVSGDIFARTLNPGWDITGGGRVLFFNHAMDAAWVVDLSISNIHDSSRGSVPINLLNIPVPAATISGITFQPPPQDFTVVVRDYNRTFTNYCLGREYYLWGAPNCNCNTCRVGVDLGGSYGTAKLDVSELRHRTKVVYGGLVALHSDLEFPCGCTVFTAGFRLEWDDTTSQIMQSQNNGNLMDVNMLLTAGVRF